MRRQLKRLFKSNRIILVSSFSFKMAMHSKSRKSEVYYKQHPNKV